MIYEIGKTNFLSAIFFSNEASLVYSNHENRIILHYNKHLQCKSANVIKVVFAAATVMILLSISLSISIFPNTSALKSEAQMVKVSTTAVPGQPNQNQGQPQLICADNSSADPSTGICRDGSKAILTLFTCTNGLPPDANRRCSNGSQAMLVSVACADGSIPNIATGICRDGSQPRAIQLVCADGSSPNPDTRKCRNGSQPRPATGSTIPTGPIVQLNLVCADGTNPNAAPNLNGKCIDGSQPRPSTGSSTPTAPAGADRTSPTIVSVKPANGATGVAVTSPITVTFSEPVQSSTVSLSTFTLKDKLGKTIFGTVTTPAAGANINTATFKPSSSLAFSKSYVATVTAGLRDLAGNPMINEKKWSFKTTTQAPAGQPNLVCADGTNPNAAPNLNGKCIDGSQPRPAAGTPTPPSTTPIVPPNSKPTMLCDDADDTILNIVGELCPNGRQPRVFQLMCTDGKNPNATPTTNGQCLDDKQLHVFQLICTDGSSPINSNFTCRGGKQPVVSPTLCGGDDSFPNTSNISCADETQPESATWEQFLAAGATTPTGTSNWNVQQWFKTA